ncbi:MAG: ribonuclease HI [Lactobacillales bacterium]|jgi:ribonuclease HI|nr:ribonuclease HI [Lactobacillales bacterium]
MATETVTVYTDGGSRNTGNHKGGHVNSTDRAAWAFLILHEEKRYTGSAGVLGATNNQMELTAILEALRKIYRKKLANKKIILISDSKYALDSINKGWLAGWAKNNWRNSTKKEVKNRDIWEAIYKALPYFPRITFEWTKGHADNEGNNFVDSLLNQTMDNMPTH